MKAATRIMLAVAALLLPLGTLAALDLTAVRNEPDLEKRSEKALEAADSAFQASKKAARDGEATTEAAGLATVHEAVDLAMKSLDETGKNARRSPKYFKKAEIALRKLIRNLDDFRFAKGADDRKPAEDLIAFVHEAHDKVLLGIMTKKK